MQGNGTAQDELSRQTGLCIKYSFIWADEVTAVIIKSAPAIITFVLNSKVVFIFERFKD
jgi:hypothetical protein